MANRLADLNNARRPFAVLITPANGAKRYQAVRFTTYLEALEYCRNNISYTGNNRVKKVEIELIHLNVRELRKLARDRRASLACARSVVKAFETDLEEINVELAERTVWRKAFRGKVANDPGRFEGNPRKDEGPYVDHRP